MIGKLKAFGDAVKNIVVYLVSPIIALGVLIFYLWNKKTAAENELGAAKAGGKLEELQTEQKATDSTAADALANYEQLRQQYLSSNNSSGGQSASGQGQPNSDPGHGNGSGPTAPAS